ncbi:MAG: hypothetical protein NTX56_11775 [Proteobacteria bacterium]|nr:hypothetical protein [Pseudomonadota bacterium]
MKPREKRIISSKEVLEKIGITEDMPDSPFALLDEEYDDAKGDLVPMLRERYTQLKLVQHQFKAGMVVMWKAGLKNRRWPAYGKPAIIVKALDITVFDGDEANTPYFREPLDIVIGFFIDSGEHRGDFVTFHVNSECFQPWSGEEV